MLSPLCLVCVCRLHGRVPIGAVVGRRTGRQGRLRTSAVAAGLAGAAAERAGDTLESVATAAQSGAEKAGELATSLGGKVRSHHIVALQTRLAQSTRAQAKDATEEAAGKAKAAVK